MEDGTLPHHTMARLSAPGRPSEDVRHFGRQDFVGSPQTIAERIHRLSEIGFDYVILQPSPALKTLAKIEEELIPIL